MAQIHIAISDPSDRTYLLKPLSTSYSIKKWGSADAMLSAPDLQPGDVAIVGENWAINNKSTLSDKPFPRFIVLINEDGRHKSSSRIAKAALEWMEAGAIECITTGEESMQVKGVLDYILQQDAKIKMKSEKYRGLWMMLSFSLVIMVGILFASLFQKESPFQTSDMPKDERFYHVLTPSPSGIALDGKNIWISDWYSQSISSYRIEGDLVFQDRFNFKGFSPAAITKSSDGLWSLGSDRRLRLHQISPTFPVVKKFKIGPESYAGLAWDGESLWTTAVNSSELVRWAVSDTVEVIERYQTSVAFPVGLVVKNDIIWVLDGKTGDILTYRKAGDDIDFVKKLGLSYFSENMNQPAGFGGDGKTLWVTADKSGLVYSLKL